MSCAKRTTPQSKAPYPISSTTPSLEGFSAALHAFDVRVTLFLTRYSAHARSFCTVHFADPAQCFCPQVSATFSIFKMVSVCGEPARITMFSAFPSLPGFLR